MAQISDQYINEFVVFYAHKKTDIYFPIRNSRRVKYTCFHVCPTYLGFGSSSGGVYLFKKCQNSNYDYLFTILNADNCGPITCVAFAANDDHMIAMATSRGHLIVAEIEPEKGIYNCSWNIVYQCNSFTKHSINIIKWDQYYDYRLYISDESGQTFVLHNIKDLKSLMVLPMPSLILKMIGKTYQMEICLGLLLLSTEHRYVLYDVSAGELTQIGKKSVRSDGQYGVCFYPKNISGNNNHISNHNCIFVSRPKSRLWECDLKGNVRFTHQFKELLINQVPQKIINGEDICFVSLCADNALAINGKDVSTAQTPTFGKLCVMNIECLDTSFIITSTTNGTNTCLYVINPINGCIVSYCALNVSYIQDMYCFENNIYLIHKQIEDKKLKLIQISVQTLEQCLQVLVTNNDLRNGANLVVKHIKYFENIVQNHRKSELKINKLLETIWSDLRSDERPEFQPLEQLISKIRSNENNFFVKSQESFHNSIDSMSSDIYNRHTDPLCLKMGFQYNNPSIDVVDIGFNELKKLKDIVLSKLNSYNNNEIDINLKLPVLSVLSSDNDRKQLENNKTINCLEVNNKINSTEDKIRNELKFVLQSLENEFNSYQFKGRYKCECGSPLPGSHLNLSEIQEKIRRFIDENSNFLNYSVTDLIDMTERNGIWHQCMALILKRQEFDKYLKYSLMLNDVKLLDSESIQNYLLSAENFKQLLRLFSKQRDVGSDQIVRCIECHKSLTDIQNSIKWETIVRICIKSIGVEEAIALLNQFIDRKPLFSMDFYLLVLRMRIISVNQSPVTRKTLNQLIDHLNTVSRGRSPVGHSPALSPSPSCSSMASNSQYSRCKGYKIKVCEEKCVKCKLDLIQRKSYFAETFVAFYCKHVFHKSCLKSTENYCIVCENKSNN